MSGRRPPEENGKQSGSGNALTALAIAALGDIIAVGLGILLAISAVILTEADSIDNFRFRAGLVDMERMKEELKATVIKFDRKYVALYTSGGDYIHLNDMPAANLLKRWLVQDVNSWSSEGMILSHDRYALNIKDVELLGPDMAAVVTAENWVLLMRNRETGKRTRGQKKNLIRVRYILKRIEGAWKVLDFEVYAPEDELPPLAGTWGP